MHHSKTGRSCLRWVIFDPCGRSDTALFVCFASKSAATPSTSDPPLRANNGREQVQHTNALLGHLVGAGEQLIGNCRAKRFGGLLVDDQFEFCGGSKSANRPAWHP